MRTWFVALMVSWIAISWGVEPASGEEALEIVQRSIEHHGGEIYLHSESQLRLCSGSGCYEITVRMNDGLYRYRVAGPVSAGHRDVETSNDELTYWHEGELAEVGPANEQNLRDWAMARVYFVYLPFRLNDPSVIQTDLGLENWEGRLLHKVKVTFSPGSSTDAQDEFIYWFNPESARLEQFAYSFDADPDGIRFRSLFNYRRIGGVLFFDQHNHGAEGDHLSVDQITPEFVETSMRHISTVTLEEVRVERLAAGS
jgi:hypothetical protein